MSIVLNLQASLSVTLFQDDLTNKIVSIFSQEVYAIFSFADLSKPFPHLPALVFMI